MNDKTFFAVIETISRLLNEMKLEANEKLEAFGGSFRDTPSGLADMLSQLSLKERKEEFGMTDPKQIIAAELEDNDYWHKFISEMNHVRPWLVTIQKEIKKILPKMNKAGQYARAKIDKLSEDRP